MIFRILPLSGISLIGIYWSVLQSNLNNIRNSFSCYNNIGYFSIMNIHQKSILFSLLKNCSNLPKFKLINFNIIKNNIYFQFPNSTFLELPFNQKINQFEIYILNSSYFYLYLEFSIHLKKFNSFLSRKINFQRNGIIFSISQSFELIKIIKTNSIIINYLLPFFSFISLFFRKKNLISILIFSISLIPIFFHFFLFGEYLPFFRFICSISWLLEFFLFFQIQFTTFYLFIPFFLILIAISFIFYGIYSNESKWFNEIFQSFFVVYSLMVGDHINDSLISLFGSFSFSFIIRWILFIFLILSLAFLIIPSFERPFTKFMSFF